MGGYKVSTRYRVEDEHGSHWEHVGTFGYFNTKEEAEEYAIRSAEQEKNKWLYGAIKTRKSLGGDVLQVLRGENPLWEFQVL